MKHWCRAIWSNILCLLFSVSPLNLCGGKKTPKHEDIDPACQQDDVQAGNGFNGVKCILLELARTINESCLGSCDKALVNKTHKKQGSQKTRRTKNKTPSL